MMEPTATLRDLLEALVQHEWDRVEELKDNLLSWMERGGFPPTTIGHQRLGREWHRAAATFICHAAASKVRDARRRRSRQQG